MLVVGIALPRRVGAEEEQAAILRVMVEGVEIQRSGAQNRLSVAQDAEMPFGVGDTLRTDRSGRAFLVILDAQVLVLPGAAFTLLGFQTDNRGEIEVQAQIEGRVFFALPAASQIDHFRVSADRLLVTQPAQLFGMQSYPNEPDYLVVANGAAVALVDGEEIQVRAGAGLRVDQKIEMVDPMPTPLHFAHLEETLYGCAGVVNTNNNLDLRVRSTPFEGYYTFGSYPQGSPIELIGKSQNERWYFARYHSTFGWVLALAVITDCDLPKIPDDSFKDYYGAANPQPFELQLLEPFYGTPEDDPFFYRQIIN